MEPPIRAGWADLVQNRSVEKVLSAYQVERLIGRGGMGEVYLAQDRRLDRPVALKVLGSDLAGDEARPLPAGSSPSSACPP
jgi:serine/threonine protein kinase